jgi:chloride channel 7
MDREPP